jgi:hypothetical protein
VIALLEQALMQLEGFAAAVFALLLGLLILWILVSIPVWIAAKVLTVGKARFTRAMLVTAVGPIIYAAVFIISGAVLAATIGEQFAVAALSFIIAFFAWIAVFKWGFETGWIRALGIAILATILFIVLGIIVTIALQAVVPDVPPITPFPTF